MTKPSVIASFEKAWLEHFPLKDTPDLSKLSISTVEQQIQQLESELEQQKLTLEYLKQNSLPPIPVPRPRNISNSYIASPKETKHIRLKDLDVQSDDSSSDENLSETSPARIISHSSSNPSVASKPELEIDHIHIKSSQDLDLFHARFKLLSHILVSETKDYNIFSAFLQAMKSIKDSYLKASSKRFLPQSDFKILYENLHLEQINSSIYQFKHALEMSLKDYNAESEFYTIFKDLKNQLHHFSTFIESQPQAMKVIHKLEKSGKEGVDEILNITPENSDKTYNIKEIFHIPVLKHTNFLEETKKLLMATPTHHNDYENLAMLIRKTTLDAQKNSKSKPKLKNVRKIELKKSGLLIEWSNKRKQRFIVLFNSCLICFKYEESTKRLKPKDIIWIIMLAHAKLEREVEGSIEAGLSPDELEEKRKIIRQMRFELNEKEEILSRGVRGKEAKAAQRDKEKIWKELSKVEKELLLNAPTLCLRIGEFGNEGNANVQGKNLDKLLLTASDYDREDWFQAITSTRHSFYKQEYGFKVSFFNFISDHL